MIFIIGGLILAVILFVILVYNNFISLDNRVVNAWAQVNVQLKKRADLIPALVDIVKGYANYERKTLKEITMLRSELLNVNSVAGKYEVNKALGEMVNKFFVIAEDYPSLKADENFLKLQEELSDVEDKIAFTRQFYNDTVYKFNTKLQSFPYSLVAKFMGLVKKDSFNEKTDYEGVIF